MKLLFRLLLIILLSNCNSGSKNDTTSIEKDTDYVENSLELETYIEPEKSVKADYQTDIFCDTTKFTDFKNNLKINDSITGPMDYQNYLAEEFINHECSRDSLFCGEITMKQLKTYKYNNVWSINLVGYVIDQGIGMEDNSASFFILTIYKNNKAWFTDILSDLMGEIKVELNGFEDKNSQVKVWGHVYPYFEPDYGKFELTIDGGTGFYEYECHSEH